MIKKIKKSWSNNKSYLYYLIIRSIALVSLVLLLITILMGLPYFLNYEVNNYLVPMAIVFGGLLGLTQWLKNESIRTSKEFLNSAISFLEKSYEVLSPVYENSLPSNDRMVWMRSSRLLLTSLDLAENIIDETHKIIFIETKEYWRGMFHELLFPNGDKNAYSKDYYADDVNHFIMHIEGQRSPISQLSLAIIYRFALTRENVYSSSMNNDPYYKEYKNIEKFSNEEIDEMRTFGPRPLGDLMNDLNEIRKPKEEN